MKRHIIFSFFSIVFSCTAFSQVTLSFAGQLANNSYIQLDSVVVENLTNSWSETIIYPDNNIVFPSASIAEIQYENLSLECFPNPFLGTTSVRLTTATAENYTLMLYDLSGKLLAENTLHLDNGTSLFEISLKKPQMAILSIVSAHGHSYAKLLNRGNALADDISFIGNIEGREKLQSTLPFTPGNDMRYTGYGTYNGNIIVSTPIEQSQWHTQGFTLVFTPNLPVVLTSAVSNVSSSAAMCGGNVISDGGSPITERGVCWSISQNPTINDIHTSDSSGTGIFTSNITGLISGTFYFVRAYATNTYGTAYGNETFVLATPENIPRPLPGVFSVSPTESVMFSKGNLQYTTLGAHEVASGDTLRGTWRFAEHQWETIGTANNNISSTYTGWIDLFGWGTSGYHDTNDIYNTNYYPYSYDTTSVNRQYNWWGYGPSSNMPDTNLIGTSANYDWGIFNAISNGGNTPNVWRTLTLDECNYLASSRTDAAQKWGLGYVNSVYGIILIPDDWIQPQGIPFTPGIQSNNNYTAAEWSLMENSGAVFLPSEANRYFNVASGAAAYYWTSTNLYLSGDHSNLANYHFTSTPNSGFFHFGGLRRNFGASVRLVTNAK